MMDANSTTNTTTPAVLMAVWDARVAVYREHLRRCREAFDVDAVHDLRVAIRRLLALLALLHQLGVTGRKRRLRDRLKRQLSGLGKLRDVQMMLDSVPRRHGFAALLREREQQCLARAQRDLQDFPAGKVLRRLEKVHNRLLALPAEAVNRQHLLAVVDDSFAVVLARHAAVDAARPASIHRERIAFKHFRYAVEIVHELSSADISVAALKALRRYQTLLGAIQDADVLLLALQQRAGQPDGEVVHSLLQRQQRRHALAVSRYLAKRDTLRRLWRRSCRV